MVLAIDIKFSCEFPGSQTLNFCFSKKEAYKFFKRHRFIQHSILGRIASLYKTYKVTGVW